MRVVLLVGLLGACTFSQTIGGDDEPGETVTLTDGELAGTAGDGVVEGGNVTPDGFVVGGLHARGYQTQLVDDGDDIAKVLADAAGQTQLGAGYAQVPADWGNPGRPRGLGLTNSNGYTVIYDGEILLPMGEVTIEVDSDDRSVVELRGGLIQNDGMLTFSVETGGWYPIQAAVTQATGAARLTLTIVQGPVRTPVDGARLRSRVTAAEGLAVLVFDGERFVDQAAPIVSRPTVAVSFGAFPNFDTDTSIDHFSLRFAGQLKIDAPGTYAFAGTADADDNWRVWVDGEVVANHWLGLTDASPGSVDLTAGWHTFLVDYNEAIGAATLALSMTGPDAPSGGPIDPKHLRPVVVMGNTYTFSTLVPTEIKDLMSTFVLLPLPGDPLERIDAVDYAFRIDNQLMSTLAVTLFDCTAGKTLTTGAAPGYFYYAADKTCAGEVTNPPIDWQFRFADNAVDNPPFVGNGIVRDYGLSALYHGGPRTPFAGQFTYTSELKPTPGATRIAAVRATGALDDATIQIEVRAADDAVALETQPYEVVREGVRIESAGEFVQYRVTISTDGWISPVLDAVEIDYIAQ